MKLRRTIQIVVYRYSMHVKFILKHIFKGQYFQEQFETLCYRQNLFYLCKTYYAPHLHRGVYRNHFVCTYVCAYLLLVSNFFMALTLACLIWHIGCISLRRCVLYIRDPDMMVTLYLKVKFIGILTCLCFRSLTSFCFDIAILSS